MEQPPNEPPLHPEQQSHEGDREFAEYHERIEQASRTFNLEQMTGEQVLQLNAALEAQADDATDSTLFDGLDFALRKLPAQNLDKAYELMAALVLSDSEWDNRLAGRNIISLLCAEEEPPFGYDQYRYEDPNNDRGIQLWLKVVAEADPDLDYLGSVLGEIATMGEINISDADPRMSPRMASRIVCHLTDLFLDTHPYLRYDRSDHTLYGGILGSESTQ